jgi:hypothetical protein
MYGELTAAVIRLLSGSQCSRCRGKMQVHSSLGVRVSVWRCQRRQEVNYPVLPLQQPFSPASLARISRVHLGDLPGEAPLGPTHDWYYGAGPSRWRPHHLPSRALCIIAHNLRTSLFPGPSTRPANSSSSPPFEDRGITGPAPCLCPQGREIRSKPQCVVCYTLTNWKHFGKNSGGLGAAGCMASTPTSPGGRVFRLQMRHTSS